MKRFIETLEVSWKDETFHEPKLHETFAKFHKHECTCALMPGWGYIIWIVFICFDVFWCDARWFTGTCRFNILRLKCNKKFLENGSPEAQINSKTINLKK